jgi:hypothetical protein
MKKLTVKHNHGVVVLENAEEYTTESGARYVRGTVIGGGCTNRLFSATSYKEHEVGTTMDWCIGSSEIYKTESGSFQVSAVFL